jgi:hypothetical protein
MRFLCTKLGMQSEDQRAVVVTTIRVFFAGRGIVTTRLYRKWPNKAADLLCPLLTQCTLGGTLRDAERQHSAVWTALQSETLDKDVLEELFPKDVFAAAAVGHGAASAPLAN